VGVVVDETAERPDYDYYSYVSYVSHLVDELDKIPVNKVNY
jgi:hypothetical protein